MVGNVFIGIDVHIHIDGVDTDGNVDVGICVDRDDVE